MKALVSHLFRYPIKGFSPEPVASVNISKQRGFPGDRAFAIALPRNDFDESKPVAKRKSEFLMLAKFPRLAAIRAAFDNDRREITLSYDGSTITESVNTDEGRSMIARFLQPFYETKNRNDGHVRLVAGSEEHRFTDVGPHSAMMMHAVSLLNANTVRELEKIAGTPLDIRRFRANIVVDGLPAWAEQDMQDRDFQIGDITFRGVWPTSRCAATQVDPDSGVRDINVPKLLKTNFDHQILGMYVSSCSDGLLSVGDEVEFDVHPDFEPHYRYVHADKKIGESVESAASIKTTLENEFRLPSDQATIIANEPVGFEYFKAAANSLTDKSILGRLMVNELFGRLKKSSRTIDQSPVSPESLGVLGEKLESGAVTSAVVKQTLDAIWIAPHNEKEILKALESYQKISIEKLASICSTLTEAHPEEVKKFQDGKESILGWFVGLVMQETQGKADPQAVRQELIRLMS